MTPKPASILDWDETQLPIRAQVLDYARELTLGDRNKTYGAPHINLSIMADIYTATSLQRMSPREAVLAMIAAKLSRLHQSPTHSDTLVDIVAYCAILAEVIYKTEREPNK